MKYLKQNTLGTSSCSSLLKRFTMKIITMSTLSPSNVGANLKTVDFFQNFYKNDKFDTSSLIDKVKECRDDIIVSSFTTSNSKKQLIEVYPSYYTGIDHVELYTDPTNEIKYVNDNLRNQLSKEEYESLRNVIPNARDFCYVFSIASDMENTLDYFYNKLKVICVKHSYNQVLVDISDIDMIISNNFNGGVTIDLC